MKLVDRPGVTKVSAGELNEDLNEEMHQIFVVIDATERNGISNHQGMSFLTDALHAQLKANLLEQTTVVVTRTDVLMESESLDAPDDSPEFDIAGVMDKCRTTLENVGTTNLKSAVNDDIKFDRFPEVVYTAPLVYQYMLKNETHKTKLAKCELFRHDKSLTGIPKLQDKLMEIYTKNRDILLDELFRTMKARCEILTEKLQHDSGTNPSQTLHNSVEILRTLRMPLEDKITAEMNEISKHLKLRSTDLNGCLKEVLLDLLRDLKCQTLRALLKSGGHFEGKKHGKPKLYNVFLFF